MTPLMLEVLTHVAVSPSPFPRMSTAAEDVQESLVLMGAIEQSPYTQKSNIDNGKVFRLTLLGEAWFEAIVNTPLPEIRYFVNGEEVNGSWKDNPRKYSPQNVAARALMENMDIAPVTKEFALDAMSEEGPADTATEGCNCPACQIGRGMAGGAVRIDSLDDFIKMLESVKSLQDEDKTEPTEH